MNTLKTLLTIALLGMSSLAMAESSSLLDKAYAAAEELNRVIDDYSSTDSDQDGIISGQVDHDDGRPSDFSDGVSTGTGYQSLGSIVTSGSFQNDTGSPIKVYATGGSCANCSGSNSNPCSVAITVDGGLVDRHVNNNNSYAKSCSANAYVTPGASYRVISRPWPTRVGRASVRYIKDE